IDEANGPIGVQLQRACHDTLPWLISFSLGSHVLPAAALERTNAAIFGVRHEVDKLAAHLAELHRRRFFKRLRDVESAQINKLECRFDVFSILCAKAGTAQSDHVESKDR